MRGLGRRRVQMDARELELVTALSLDLFEARAALFGTPRLLERRRVQGCDPGRLFALLPSIARSRLFFGAQLGLGGLLRAPCLGFLRRAPFGVALLGSFALLGEPIVFQAHELLEGDRFVAPRALRSRHRVT